MRIPCHSVLFTALYAKLCRKPLRDEAKQLRRPILAAAIAQKRHIYVEWTAQQNLQTFQRGEDEHLPLEEHGYDVVLVFVSCPDVDGILKQHAGGSLHKRMVPPTIIEEYNRDRSVYFVEAVNALHGRGIGLRAFVAERENCKSSECMLTEVTSALPIQYRDVGAEDASLSEPEASALLQAQINACRDAMLKPGAELKLVLEDASLEPEPEPEPEQTAVPTPTRASALPSLIGGDDTRSVTLGSPRSPMSPSMRRLRGAARRVGVSSGLHQRAKQRLSAAEVTRRKLTEAKATQQVRVVLLNSCTPPCTALGVACRVPVCACVPDPLLACLCCANSKSGRGA